MKIALIGAAGNVGSRLLKELTDRGHQVTAVDLNPDAVAKVPGVTPIAADVGNVSALSKVLYGHDVVISAVRFLISDPNKLIEAIKTAGVKRYVVVGGAASLEVAPGVRLLDTPNFPAQYKDEANAGAVFLGRLRKEDSLDWTFLSPSALFTPGERTGKFRLGGDQLLSGEGGSKISFEDYAIALVDEVEKPAHIKKRFTVGY